MVNLPLVSIVIPNYNKEKYIEETLSSVLAQSYHKWECIIIDDNSSDTSVERIQKFLKKDSRLKYIKRDKDSIGGGSACRNIGIHQAKGDYLIFLDSDDLLAKGCLEHRVKSIERTNLDFAVFSMGTFNETVGDNNFIWNPPKRDHLAKFLSHEIPWTITCPIWKTSVLKELGGFDTDYPRLQDVELHTRVLLTENIQYKVFLEQTPDCYYRIDEGRIVSDVFSFCDKLVNGVIIYISKIHLIIEKKPDLDISKNLKGTVFSTINNLLHRKQIQQINQAEYDLLRENLLKSNGVKQLFTKRNFKIISLYENLYNFGFCRIKGFNYLTKKIISF